MRTEAPIPTWVIEDGITKFRFNHAVLGLNSELYEHDQAVKDMLDDGSGRDALYVAEEHGDFWWYLALGTAVAGLELKVPMSPAYGCREAMSRLCELSKRFVVYGQPLDRPHAAACFGSIAAWSEREIRRLRFSLDQILAGNLAKLATRYGEKFKDVGAIQEYRNVQEELRAMRKAGGF